MVEQWSRKATELYGEIILSADTKYLIEKRTGKNSMTNASDYERAEVVRRLQDLAALVNEYIRANEPAAELSFEDVFHCLYGYRFAL